MLTAIKHKLIKIVDPLVDLLVMMGLSPNILTITGLALSVFFFFLTWINGFSYYLFTLTVFGASTLIDALDGAVARKTGRTSSWGAFMDSFIDRISDALFILAFAVLKVVSYQVACLELVGAYLISYSRARGETLGVKMESVGIAERAERILIMFSSLIIAFWSKDIAAAIFYLLIAVTYITVFQRVIHVKKALGAGL